MSGVADDQHPTVEELDSLLDDGAAGTSTRTHVGSCERCASRVAELAVVQRLLREAGRQVPPPPVGLDELVGAALERASAGGSPAADRSRDVVPLRGRTSRVPRWVGLAAGLVVLAGAGVTASQLLGDGFGTPTALSGADAGSAESSARDEQAATPVHSTGTDYTRDQLGAQVEALLEAGPPPTEVSPHDAMASAPEGGSAEAESGFRTQPGTRDFGAAEPLTTPEGLAGCLEALDAEGTTPEAVDLATWQGQEVAVLVLEDGDQHAVWVVERTCSPGADGFVHYQSVAR